jgi:hypothetical protein
VCVTNGVEPFAGVSGNLIVLVAHNGRSAADPIMRRLPSRMYSLLSDMFPSCVSAALVVTTSSSLSVEIPLERLIEDVLVCPPLSSPKRAKTNVCALIHFKRQRNAERRSGAICMARCSTPLICCQRSGVITRPECELVWPNIRLKS